MSVAIAMSACESWLDVEPKTEIKSDIMFESESGFKDANIGCYMLMGNQSLYGKELTSGFVDVIGQVFSTDATGSYGDIQKYEYDKAENIINNIWSQMYTTIANVNNILENIDSKRDILQPAVYHIFKGEALGLRAFLHFELLRAFGWGDLENHPEYLKNKAIPYVTSYNKAITEQYAEEKVLEFIHRDLEAAAAELEGYDPWSTTHKAADSELIDEEGFFKNRMTRFNYWAVQATRARVYMWEGKRDKALPIVQNFISSQSSITDLRWVIKDDVDKKDMTFSKEHIFRLDVNKLYEGLKTIIDSKIGVNPNNNMLYHDSDNARTWFEVDKNVGISDYRYKDLYTKTGGSKWSNRKFLEEENATFKNMMPLIRMSEMYYMAAECLNAAGKKKEAVDMLNTVRKARNIDPLNDLKPTLSQAEIQQEVEKEYRKEFLGEGQAFYLYKRLGHTEIPTPKSGVSVATSETVYVLQIPEDEINVGGREPNISTDKK